MMALILAEDKHLKEKSGVTSSGESVSASALFGKHGKQAHGKSKGKCFNCGKPGHFADDPKCERYRLPQPHAIQEEDETNSSSSSSPEEDLNDTSIPEHQDKIPLDNESEGEWTLEPYKEEYIGCIYDQNDEFHEFLGHIR